VGDVEAHFNRLAALAPPVMTVTASALAGVEARYLDGRPVAVLAQWAGPTVVDLEDGASTIIGDPWPAYSVRCLELDGRTCALVGGEDGTVRLIDLLHRVVLRSFRGHERRVTRIALANGPQELSCFATASIDGDLCAWNLGADGWNGRRLTGAHDLAVLGLVVGAVEGQQVIVSAGADGYVRFLDLDGMHERHSRVWADVDQARAMLLIEFRGRPTVVVAGISGSIVLLDLATGSRVSGPHVINDGGIESVAPVELAGRPLLVCGLTSMNWLGPRVWDLTNERVLPGPVPWRPSGFHHVAPLAGAQPPTLVVAYQSGDDQACIGAVVPEIAQLETSPPPGYGHRLEPRQRHDRPRAGQLGAPTSRRRHSPPWCRDDWEYCGVPVRGRFSRRTGLSPAIAVLNQPQPSVP
jgi:hypothetical protein